MTIRLTDPTDHLGHDSRDEQARVEQLLDYLEDPEAPSCGCCGGVFTDGTPDNSLCAVCEQGELHADNDAVETAVEDCLGPDSTVWLWHPDDRWHCRADTTVENAVATDPWRSPTAVTWEPAVTEGRDVDRSTWNNTIPTSSPPELATTSNVVSRIALVPPWDFAPAPTAASRSEPDRLATVLASAEAACGRIDAALADISKTVPRHTTRERAGDHYSARPHHAVRDLVDFHIQTSCERERTTHA